ncbi:hypothetical protein CTI12_AA389780 [Artemisia annua]|uniref:RRM domain-containing protein n=1 Tax=Artemisia annua TaxID=35608 RepID=A0A2U1MDA7_ARTAN|nr:hypothetical protein CTI12_AA389780 [Artemisia annua]
MGTADEWHDVTYKKNHSTRTRFDLPSIQKILWNACKQYGFVVDAFIPDRRSKVGKRYGFVRFIKLYDVDRLVNNLCTVWIGSHHLHANVAKFNRPSATPNEKINGETRAKPKEGHNNNDQRVNTNSYAHAVKGESTVKEYTESKPVLVLDDSCVNQHGYHLGLMGKVKEFTLCS